MTRQDVFYAVDPRDAELANVLHDPDWRDVVGELIAPVMEWLIIVTAVPCLLVAAAFAIVLAAPLAVIQVLIGEE